MREPDGDRLSDLWNHMDIWGTLGDGYGLGVWVASEGLGSFAYASGTNGQKILVDRSSGLVVAVVQHSSAGPGEVIRWPTAREYLYVVREALHSGAAPPEAFV